LVFIVNDLLRLTEAEDVGFQIHKENLNLRASIAEVMVAFEDEASRKDLSIQGEYDYAVPGTIRKPTI
jgi:signal transduction histidine kinase